MIGKIAVSAANFAIDKPYSYVIPEGLSLQPGIRVVVPFGRGNRQCEGVVLSVEEGSAEGLKAVQTVLDKEPLLSDSMLRLAAFLRQRCYCSFYDAIRAMLPAGLWFRTTEHYSLTEDRSWQEKNLRRKDAVVLLQVLADCGGSCDGCSSCGNLGGGRVEDIYRPYIDGEKELREINEEYRRGLVK